jgi:DNA (cytosine-5)-methyltransferase 1
MSERECDNAVDDTERYRVLNLYAGLGGNRKRWGNVDVVAVEKNPKIARFYSNEFPEDEVIVADAHTFLEQHLRDDWDFIWASPPCQSHSRFNTVQWNSDSKRNRNREPRYPDMRLYQEIVLLQNFAECDWVVENVTSYYDPLIEPQRIDRHYIWSNRYIPDFEGRSIEFKTNGEYAFWEEMYGFDVSDVDLGLRKDQALKNCVDPALGEHIFDSVMKIRQETLVQPDGGCNTRYRDTDTERPEGPR